MDCKKVGLLIKQKRLEKNMTQQELADRLHITDRAISNWERGLRAPDISLLQELSNILGLSISDILSGEVQTTKGLTRIDKMIISLCLLLRDCTLITRRQNQRPFYNLFFSLIHLQIFGT